MPGPGRAKRAERPQPMAGQPAGTGRVCSGGGHFGGAAEDGGRPIRGIVLLRQPKFEILERKRVANEKN